MYTTTRANPDLFANMIHFFVCELTFYFLATAVLLSATAAGISLGYGIDQMANQTGAWAALGGVTGFGFAAIVMHELRDSIMALVRNVMPCCH